ncbi:MAG: aminopeptidase [Candidatus Thermoplasmatota archaeon]|nr:aminopeptidase [Candidatus Thermoplasmatota archaeon]
MDVEEKARATLVNSLGLKGSERALILCDIGSIGIGEVFYKAAVRMTRDAYMMVMPKGKHHGAEPPPPVTSMMMDSDVIIAPTTFSLTYTNAARASLAAGSRIATMPGITKEMLERGGFEADYSKIARSIRRFGRMFSTSKRIRITSKEGTDLLLLIKGREWIMGDNGLCLKRGSITNLPAGEVFIAPVENSARGTLVVDGVFSQGLETPLTIHIKDGVIQSVDGINDVSQLFRGKKCSRVLSEIGIGMNPHSMIIGNILEDQKALGTVHIGFGDNSTFGGRVICDMHNDGMLLHPTLDIGGVKVIEDGKFVLDL